MSLRVAVPLRGWCQEETQPLVSGAMPTLAQACGAHHREHVYEA